MEIITFDHEVYKDLSDKIGRIADYVLKKEERPQHAPEIWLTSEELADLLKISTRTLQRMRKERIIPYTMMRSKCLYRLSDVEESIDRQTNETIAIPVDAIRIPDEVKGVKLDKEQQVTLAAGKGVYLEGMTSKSGKKFNATIQINADKQGLDFHFGGRRQAQHQELKNRQTQDDGRKVYIGKTLLGLPILDEMRQGWAQNKWVLMEGLTDKKGRTFDAYVRPNHEKGKYDFRRTVADPSQIHEIKPTHASQTQVAVNSEGKTYEATKHTGEPLKKGQTAPANTKQQERQQQGENRRPNPHKRSGLKM